MILHIWSISQKLSFLLNLFTKRNRKHNSYQLTIYFFCNSEHKCSSLFFRCTVMNFQEVHVYITYILAIKKIQITFLQLNHLQHILLTIAIDFYTKKNINFSPWSPRIFKWILKIFFFFPPPPPKKNLRQPSIPSYLPKYISVPKCSRFFLNETYMFGWACAIPNVTWYSNHVTSNNRMWVVDWKLRNPYNPNNSTVLLDLNESFLLFCWNFLANDGCSTGSRVSQQFHFLATEADSCWRHNNEHLGLGLLKNCST